MRTLLVVAVLVVVSACSSTEAGTPAVTTPASPIPAVQDPKDVSGIAPCDLLTEEQLVTLGIDQPGEVQDFEEISGVPACVWTDTADTRRFSIGVATGRDSLRNRYLTRGRVESTEITEVAGHPALRSQVEVGGISCTYLVGTAPNESVDVNYTTLGAEVDLCAEAERVAEVVLSNLPPKA